MKTVKLPAVFWRDHYERDLPSGRLLKETRSEVTIEATDAELAEILHDAEHYADKYGPDGEGLSGLKASARATIKRLTA